MQSLDPILPERNAHGQTHPTRRECLKEAISANAIVYVPKQNLFVLSIGSDSHRNAEQNVKDMIVWSLLIEMDVKCIPLAFAPGGSEGRAVDIEIGSLFLLLP